MEKLLSDYFEEFVAICSEYFGGVKKENSKSYLPSESNHEKNDILHVNEDLK